MSRETKAALVHFQAAYPNRAYCGTTLERDTRVTQERKATSCNNCLAALRADEEARS